MLYTIKKINRTVNLDDELVKKCKEYDELRDYTFCIVIRTKYGHAPTREEVSDSELSQLCNEILLSELKALMKLPQALRFIDKITVSSKDRNIVEYEIDNNSNYIKPGNGGLRV